MQIHAVGPGDLGRLRDVRARAVVADPEAFVVNLADEAPDDPHAWAILAGLEPEPAPPADREPRRYAAVLLALEGDRALGMAGIRWFDEAHTMISLWGMWVDPVTRGTGLGRRLVDAVGHWGAQRGAHTYRLGVFRRDGDAIGFYERLGFVNSGDRHQFAGRPAISMTRPIAPR